MMALLYRGESRKKIFKHPLFWIKVMEIALAVTIIPMIVTYSDKGGIYVKNSTNSFNITVEYPFEYTNKTVVYTDESEPLKSFSFDPAIEVCAKLFVYSTTLTCIAAITMLSVSCVVQGNENVSNKVLITELFIAVVMTFLLVITTSLWLYNLLQLGKEVEGEIVNVITTLGEDACKNCVEFLPNYTLLFSSVVLSYVLFLVWLCNTVFVFKDALNQPDDVTATSSLVWNQELSDKEHNVENVQESTAT